MKLDVIFGSTSDEENVLPGVERAVKEIPDLEGVTVHYASADNTPEKVHKIMAELKAQEGKKVYISGAGMSNVLTGVVKTYATLNDLVIGIPIIDKPTHGDSSFLSTSEKPPLNPVLTVGVNHSYTALNIGYRFIKGQFNNSLVILDKKDIGSVPISELEKPLSNLKLSYEVKTIENIDKDDLVITIFDEVGLYDTRNFCLNRVDDILKNGKGIQIGVRELGHPDMYSYRNCLGNTEASGVVSIGLYKNATQIAAQIIGDQAALEIIRQKKDEKAKKLNKHNGLYVGKDGVRKL